MAFHLNLAILIASVFFNTRWKEQLLIKNNEEVLKPQTFRIDGADPWVMTEKEWNVIEQHYMTWEFR